MQLRFQASRGTTFHVGFHLGNIAAIAAGKKKVKQKRIYGAGMLKQLAIVRRSDFSASA